MHFAHYYYFSHVNHTNDSVREAELVFLVVMSGSVCYQLLINRLILSLQALNNEPDMDGKIPERCKEPPRCQRHLQGSDPPRLTSHAPKPTDTADLSPAGTAGARPAKIRLPQDKDGGRSSEGLPLRAAVREAAGISMGLPG